MSVGSDERRSEGNNGREVGQGHPPVCHDILSPSSYAVDSGSRPSLLDAQEGRGGRSLVAGAGALVLHGGLAMLALTAGAQGAEPKTPKLISELVEVELSPARVEPPMDANDIEPAPETAPMKAVRPVSSHASSQPSESSVSVEREPPAAAAEAGKALTAEEEVIDFGNTIISGGAQGFAGGVTAANGTSKKSVGASTATANGVEGGSGSGGPGQPSQTPDRSRPPRLAGGTYWDCPFPPESDLEQINSAVVSLRVRVARSGQVQNVTVLSDPGFGFAREARRCAARKRWDPGVNSEGVLETATAQVRVQFQR